MTRVSRQPAPDRSSLRATSRSRALPARTSHLLALLIAALAWPSLAFAQVNQLPLIARNVDIEEHLGRLLPMETSFTNAQGREVLIGDYFGRGGVSVGQPDQVGAPPKATIVVLVYYKCPVACVAVLDKLADCLDKLNYTVGKDFNCLVFSFNHREGTPLAAEQKARRLTEYAKPVDSQVRTGWEFHTGTETAIRQLADTIGFQYREVGNGDYSHPIGIFIVSPEGKIVRYIYGFDYPPDQVKLALIEASEGKIAKSIGDKFAGVCFLWDGQMGKYTLNVMMITKVMGSLAVVLLGATVAGLLLHERAKRLRLAGAGVRAGARAGAGS